MTTEPTPAEVIAAIFRVDAHLIDPAGVSDAVESDRDGAQYVAILLYEAAVASLTAENQRLQEEVTALRGQGTISTEDSCEDRTIETTPSIPRQSKKFTGAWR